MGERGPDHGRGEVGEARLARRRPRATAPTSTWTSRRCSSRGDPGRAGARKIGLYVARRRGRGAGRTAWGERRGRPADAPRRAPRIAGPGARSGACRLADPWTPSEMLRVGRECASAGAPRSGGDHRSKSWRLRRSGPRTEGAVSPRCSGRSVARAGGAQGASASACNEVRAAPAGRGSRPACGARGRGRGRAARRRTASICRCPGAARAAARCTRSRWSSTRSSTSSCGWATASSRAPRSRTTGTTSMRSTSRRTIRRAR